MFTTILTLSIAIILTQIIGLALVHQAWTLNNRKHTEYTLIARNTVLLLPVIYLFLVFVLTLA